MDFEKKMKKTYSRTMACSNRGLHVPDQLIGGRGTVFVNYGLNDLLCRANLWLNVLFYYIHKSHMPTACCCVHGWNNRRGGHEFPAGSTELRKLWIQAVRQVADRRTAYSFDNKKAELSQRNRAMCPMEGCTENFQESPTTPTAFFPEIFNGLLFRLSL